MWALAAIFLVSGTLHFARPGLFEATIPRVLPARRGLVYASGAVEIGCALGLAVPATRRPAGLASAGLLVVIFPANVQMAYDARRRGSMIATALTLGRLPLQLPMIRTALRARQPSRKDPTTRSPGQPGCRFSGGETGERP